jgi:TRAP-type C4-dicarboxylate transport system substrate-binding protein
MKRKRVTDVFGIGFVALAIAVSAMLAVAPNPAPAAAKEVYRFKLQSHAPATNIMYTVAMHTAKVLEERSNGRIKIKGYPSSQIVPTREALEGVGKGVIDILVSGSGYFAGTVAVGTVFQIPYLVPSDFAVGDVFWNTDVGRLISQAYEKETNAVAMSPHQCGPYLYLFRKGAEVYKYDDLKGKKVKVAGGVSGVPQKLWGMAPLSITMGEIYAALQKGIVDAASLPIHTLDVYKLKDVIGQVVLPPVTQVGANYTWWNLDSFKKLPPDLQKLTRNIYKETFAENSQAWINADKERMPRLKKTIEFYALPKKEADAMKGAAVEPSWTYYTEQCEKQGFGEEAKAIRALLAKEGSRLWKEYETTTDLWKK